MADDVLLLIFGKYLSLYDRIRIENVCRRWQKLSRSTWKTVHSIDLQTILDDHVNTVRDPQKILLALLRRGGPYLTTLDISQHYGSPLSLDLEPKCVEKIGLHCPQLTLLDLSFIPLTDSHLKALHLSSFCQLEVLRLQRCLDGENFAEETLQRFIGSLTSLVELDLSCNDALTGACLTQVANGLEKVQLNGCVKVSTAHMRLLAERANRLNWLEFEDCSANLADLLHLLPHLQVLNLNFYQGAALQPAMRPGILPRLLVLRLAHSKTVCNSLLRNLCENCEKITELNVAGYEVYDNELVVNYSPLRRLRFLKVLDLSWQSRLADSDLLTVTCNGTLEILRLHLCCRISSNALIEVVELNPLLQFLEITGMNDSFQFVAISFVHVISVITQEQECRNSPLVLRVDRNAGLDDHRVGEFCHARFKVRIA